MKVYTVLFLLICLCCSPCVMAKTITVGDHSTSSAHYSGMHGQFKYSSAEFVLYDYELKDTGAISAMALYKCSGDTSADLDSVHIYVKESDTGIGKEVSLSGYTEVFSGVLAGSAGKGWVNLTFSAPFAYSGNKNLVILIIRKNGRIHAKGYPAFAVSFSNTKAYQAAYFLSDSDPWKGSPAQSPQNQYAQYRPYLQLTID
ncbi:MAG: hypothetical protein JNL13_05485 [Chitinophagaceae bacterium]|nr:hypothetical protein [Chitinophagaceae bacterium]